MGDLNDHHNKKAWEKIMESQFHKFQTEQPLSFIIILGGGMSNIDYIYDNIDEVIKKIYF